MLPITRAIIPAAGHGTRMRPLTSAIPKEMLPLGRKPVLAYILHELAACGIRDVLIVISERKDGIARYFEDGSHFGLRISYTVQREMMGLGDAVYQGRDWTEGGAFLVAFGDAIIDADRGSATTRLIRSHMDSAAFASVLTQRVEMNSVNRYGILAPASAEAEDSAGSGKPFAFNRIVEKPQPDHAPSCWAVAARWILSSEIFAQIESTQPDTNGEVGLSQAVDRGLQQGFTGFAMPLLPNERRLDIGSWDTYLTAAAAAIVKDPEFGEQIRLALCQGSDVAD